MARLYWKRCRAGLGIWVGVTAALVACGGDDATTPLDSGNTEDAPKVGDDASARDARADVSSSRDSSPRPDSTAADSAPDSAADSAADADTAADTTVDDAAVSDAIPSSDATPAADVTVAADAVADVAAQPPPPLDLCGTLDSFWFDETRSDDSSWPALIVSGPPSTLGDGAANPDPDVGYFGYLNVADCAVGGVYATGLGDSIEWQNQLIPFAYRFFGCAADAGADAGGNGFALVPTNMYGQPFGPDDLKKLGDWFVQSLIQAVANQSFNNPSSILTGAQIDAIEAEMAYQETLYSNIIQATGYHYSTCPDAGPEAGPEASTEAGPEAGSEAGADASAEAGHD